MNSNNITSNIINDITLLHGDCLEILDDPKYNKSIDLVLCDIPYGCTASKWDQKLDLKKMWALLDKICKIDTPKIFFCNEPYASELRLSNFKDYRYNIIWVKNQKTGFLSCNKQPLRQHEIINVFYKKNGVYYPQFSIGDPYTVKRTKQGNTYHSHKENLTVNKGSRYPTDVIYFNAPHVKNRYHNTQKPTDLLEYLIKTYSNDNALVLDLTMGSASTAIACMNTKRRFVGVEIEHDIFNIALDRVNKHAVNS